jgi:hypothetical protein
MGPVGHERVLRFLLGVKKEEYTFSIAPRGDDSFPDTWYGHCSVDTDTGKGVIVVRIETIDPFKMAHEFRHARQYKKYHKRKYRRAHRKMLKYEHTLADDYDPYSFSNFFNNRKYLYNRIEREANNFALFYCLLTLEFKYYFKNLFKMTRLFFKYRMLFGLVSITCRKIARRLNPKKHQVG